MLSWTDANPCTARHEQDGPEREEGSEVASRVTASHVSVDDIHVRKCMYAWGSICVRHGSLGTRFGIKHHSAGTGLVGADKFATRWPRSPRQWQHTEGNGNELRARDAIGKWRHRIGPSRGWGPRGICASPCLADIIGLCPSAEQGSIRLSDARDASRLLPSACHRPKADEE